MPETADPRHPSFLLKPQNKPPSPTPSTSCWRLNESFDLHDVAIPLLLQVLKAHACQRVTACLLIAPRHYLAGGTQDSRHDSRATSLIS
jgi:hypothetical protein